MKRSDNLIAVACLLVASFEAGPAAAQKDPLWLFEGIWVSVNPPGPHVIFNRVGAGTREASLPILGQASLRVSNGEHGSNLRVSGSGFDCFYFFGQINPREMTWELRGGDAVCPPSAHLKKDPP